MMDLNKLVAWAKEKQLSLIIWFNESDGSFDIETRSVSPSEEYALKGVSNENIFIEFWKQHAARGYSTEIISVTHGLKKANQSE